MSYRTRAGRRTQPASMATTETSSAAQSITSHSQIVVIPQMERSVRRFTGQAVHQDLERFLEDLEAASTSQLTSSSSPKFHYQLLLP